MKRKIMNGILGAAMTGIMVFSLTACGNNGGADSSVDSTAESGESGAQETGTPSDEKIVLDVINYHVGTMRRSIIPICLRRFRRRRRAATWNFGLRRYRPRTLSTRRSNC